MGLESFTFYATGDINPMRCVTLVTDYTVRQSIASEKPVGISRHWTRRFDSTLHAAAGDNVAVAQVGETALLTLAGTVTAGDLVTPDADGKGVKASSDNDVVGRALQDGVSGDVIQVAVNPYSSLPS